MWADTVVSWYARNPYWHETYECPAPKCDKSFDTERGLRVHMKRQQHVTPYFRYAKEVPLTDVTCECGYRPDQHVDNPVKCYRDHRRRVHREDWIRESRKMYVITIDPPI